MLKYLRTYIARHPGLRASSIQQLEIAVRQFQIWHGQPTHRSQLHEELLARFMSDCLAHGSAPATVNSKRRALLTLWRAAAGDGLVREPKKVPRVKEPLRIPEAWSLEEVERLLVRCQELTGTVGKVPRNIFWTALVLTVFDTGGRIGAVRAVKSADYDRGGHLVLRAESQKTNRDELVALSGQTVEAIDCLFDPASDLLFPWPYCYHYMWRYFRRQIVIKAGVRYDPRQGMNLFHRLRRTSGSLVEANGGDGSRHLGHSRQVFLKRYCDPRIVGSGQVDLLPRPRI